MDGFEGLAAAILGAMICMLIVPALLFGAAAYFLARKKSQRAWAFAMLGTLTGVGVGATAIAFTFYEDEMTGTTLLIEAPGLEGEWVVLIEDPTVSTEVDWSQGLAPEARVTVPSGGVLRVRSLEGLAGSSPSVFRGTTRATAMISRPAPEGLGGTNLVAYGFIDTSAPVSEGGLDALDEAAFVEWIRARE